MTSKFPSLTGLMPHGQKSSETAKVRGLGFASAVALVSLAPGLAHAQDEDAISVVPEATTEPAEAGAVLQDFEPAFFEQYAPRSALDMVGQIPGFQIRGANFQRGLSQSSANVLINGERLTGKTDVGSQLSRITVNNVVRIEIRDGASLNIPGLSGQVANIITRSSGVSGTWSWEPEFRERQPVSLSEFNIVLTGETGNLSYSAELRNNSYRNGAFGPETLTDADGTRFEIRDEVAHYQFDGPGVVLDLTWRPREDHIGNLNLEYNKTNFNGNEHSSRSALTPRGRTLLTEYAFGEDEWNASIGGDYELPLGDGKLKTIGYYRFERSPTRDQFEGFAPDGSRRFGSIFTRNADEAETIGRLEYSWSRDEGQPFWGDWQVAVEGAFNFLDIESSLERFDRSLQEFVPVALDGASSRVEEKRAEASATYSRRLSPRWDIQTSLGAEISEISQTGGLTTGLTREFIRPKGFVQATFNQKQGTVWRLRAEREVGQLNFFDFISSVDVADDFDRTGNVNLVPSQSWLGSIEYDRDFGDGITFKAKPYVAFISDLVDRIPIGDSGDAVGNIDSAVRYGIDINSTIKGDRWGWEGTQFDLTLELRDSSVDDPLLRESRRLSYDKTSFWRVDWRHDIPDTDYAYGFTVREYADAPRFNLDNITDPTLERPITIAFVEHKDISGIKVQAGVINLLDSRENFERRVFTDRRDRGSLDFVEFESRRFGPILYFEVSGVF